MTEDKFELFVSEARSVILKSVNNLSYDIEISNNDFGLFNIRHKGFSFISQFYNVGQNQNITPYFLLAIIDGYFVKDEISFEYPIIGTTIERFDIVFDSNNKIALKSQLDNIYYNDYEQLIISWLTQFFASKKSR